MKALPRNLPGSGMVWLLQKAGFSIKHKKGNHIALRRDDPAATIIVLEHQNLDTGTLDALLDDACISIEEFAKLLQRK